jgi:hypothetical protein
MIFLTLLTALGLSGVAAYYSVIGLTAIFPGSYWPIIIMGSTFEVAKLVTISWTYRNWETAPRSLKVPFIAAVLILMLITSMGIFGYLSKAHLEHSSDLTPLLDKMAMIDEKIKIEKDNIDVNRKTLKQLDEGVDQVMARSFDEKGADKAIAVRKAQQKDRSRISQEIEVSQKSINTFNEERAPLNVSLQKAESDFGPIKYIAELIYGSGDRGVIDKAVRLVIMLIMIVFDPLAVLLLIAANKSIKEQYDDEVAVKKWFDGIRVKANELDEEVKKEESETPLPEVNETPTDLKPVETTVQVEKENIANISSPAVATTTYDYTVPFAFEKAKDIASGKF